MTAVNKSKALMKGGRPLKFPDVEELNRKIMEYFRRCDENNRPYTVAGLAVCLDCDRKTLINYQKDDRFFPTIKRARNIIEAYLEEQLHFSPRTAAIIFNLKNNFGWKDKQEVAFNGELKVGKITKEDAEKVDQLFREITEE